MQKVPLTLRGADKLREELTHLKTVMRPKITEAIAEARAHGDLKENAEYHAAKEEQGHLEAKLAEMETKLANARVLSEHDVDLSKASILCSVEVLNKKMNKKMKLSLF